MLRARHVTPIQTIDLTVRFIYIQDRMSWPIVYADYAEGKASLNRIQGGFFLFSVGRELNLEPHATRQVAPLLSYGFSQSFMNVWYLYVRIWTYIYTHTHSDGYMHVCQSWVSSSIALYPVLNVYYYCRREGTRATVSVGRAENKFLELSITWVLGVK